MSMKPILFNTEMVRAISIVMAGMLIPGYGVLILRG